jgi:hypothetical protein
MNATAEYTASIRLSLSIFVVGIVAFAAVLSRHNYPAPIAAPLTDSIQILRMSAMMAAKQAGSHEYHFTAGKVPLPLSQ